MIRYLDEDSVTDLTIGSTILGAGGGGDPYVGSLLARETIRTHRPVELVDLDDVPDDARVVLIAGMGAPGVLIEKLPRASEVTAAIDALEDHFGEKFTHISPIEAGGPNALMPAVSAEPLSTPLVGRRHVVCDPGGSAPTATRETRLARIGLDDRGIKREIVVHAVDLADAVVVIHVIPTGLQR